MVDRDVVGPLSWLVLIHKLPPRPLYLRAQVRRRLAQVGSVPLKDSVYVLPDRPACLEDFQWIAQEAVSGGGEACLLRATLVDGVTSAALERRFRDQAAARFAPLAAALARHLEHLRRARGRTDAPAPAGLERLRRQVQDAEATDFFGSDAGREVRVLMKAIDQLHARPAKGREPAAPAAGDLRGRVWVTRRDPHVDRLATAWLIRRFVDPAARFRFVEPTGGTIRRGELTFDMPRADFTHEGDRCTFETMVERLGLKSPALAAMAEVVHDIDLKDGKFGRPESAGVQQLVTGLSAAHADSSARVSAGMHVFDALFASFGGTASTARLAPRARAKPAKPTKK